MNEEELKNRFDEVYTEELHKAIDELTDTIKLDIVGSDITKYCLKNKCIDVWETSVLMALAAATATVFISIHAQNKLIDVYVETIKTMISDSLKTQKDKIETD